MIIRFPTQLAIFACVIAILGLSGCSTPGPTHAYLAGLAEDPIIDLLPGQPDADIPTHLISVNELYGIAYDPFTDHLFLRSYPGHFITVIDRPARDVKRSFLIKGLPHGSGDLAIRSRDRHLFLAHPTLPAVVEITLYGTLIRTVPIEHLQSPPAGLAYDQLNDRLLVLERGESPRVAFHDLAGKRLATVPLDHEVRRVSLAYDSATAEFYVPLLNQPAVGIFDSSGRLQRTLSTSDGRSHDFVDVGPRSLLRLF